MMVLESILVFYLGALMASFAYLVGIRLPKNESIMNRSHCDYCHKTLSWFEVLPIFGYIITLGKCKSCKNKIQIRYLLIELLGGALFLLSYLLIGELNWTLLISFIMITVLFIESVSDILYQIVIDGVWMIGLAMIFVIRIIEGELWPYVLSSLTLFVILLSIAMVGQWIFKKESLGGGDIKLFLLIGFALTIYQGLLAIFLSAIIGLLYALVVKVKSGEEMAFVPMISLATMICFWFGQDMIDLYLSLLGM